MTIKDHTLFIARVVDACTRKEAFDKAYLPEKAKILLHLSAPIYTASEDKAASP